MPAGRVIICRLARRNRRPTPDPERKLIVTLRLRRRCGQHQCDEKSRDD
jgi:hypothetical protein